MLWKGDAMIYIRRYPINEEWFLLLHHGGGLPHPITVWLTHSGCGKHIDITQGNSGGAITDFIDTHNSGRN